MLHSDDNMVPQFESPMLNHPFERKKEISRRLYDEILQIMFKQNVIIFQIVPYCVLISL